MKSLRNQQGQTLIALLIFMMLAIMLATTAVAITVINTQTNDSLMNGTLALTDAENGIENALLRLERDPAYSGETMSFVDGNVTGTATITISGTTNYTITAVGTVRNHTRTVEAKATASPTGLTITDWTEKP